MVPIAIAFRCLCMFIEPNRRQLGIEYFTTNDQPIAGQNDVASRNFTNLTLVGFSNWGGRQK